MLSSLCLFCCRHCPPLPPLLLPTLSPIAAVAIAHPFEEYCSGGGREGAWGGGADFTALVPPYIFAFHMARGVRLGGLVRIAVWRQGEWYGGP